jgi:ubiquinone/menaquinone biosynthesis C-methylase UbiE
LGTEVRAFIDLGCFAVGVDIESGKESAYVLHGDFHQLQFPSNSVQVVFTNALDHAFYLEKVIAEAARVVKVEGIFVVEATWGSSEGGAPGEYESYFWHSIDDLVLVIEERALKLLRRTPFVYPYGEAAVHLVFRREA